MDRFERYSALPLAISIDSEEVHQSYLQHKWEQSREVLPFPLCKYLCWLVGNDDQITNLYRSIGPNEVYH